MAHVHMATVVCWVVLCWTESELCWVACVNAMLVCNLFYYFLVLHLPDACNIVITYVTISWYNASILTTVLFWATQVKVYMNCDLSINWKIETVKLARSAMATSVRQTLDGQTLDVQEDRIFRCKAVIAYTASNGLASSALSRLALVYIKTSLSARSSAYDESYMHPNICGCGYTP